MGGGVHSHDGPAGLVLSVVTMILRGLPHLELLDWFWGEGGNSG